MICLWGAYGCILGFVLIWYDMIWYDLVWWLAVRALYPFHVWYIGASYSMYTLWIDEYVIMWFETYSSISLGRLVAFLCFVCLFEYLVRRTFVDTCSLPFSYDYAYVIYLWYRFLMTCDTLCHLWFFLLFVCLLHCFAYIFVHWAFHAHSRFLFHAAGNKREFGLEWWE